MNRAKNYGHAVNLDKKKLIKVGRNEDSAFSVDGKTAECQNITNTRVITVGWYDVTIFKLYITKI